MTEKIMLVADDDYLLRMNAEITIKKFDENIKVYAFENGEDLLDKLKELGKCHSVFLDNDMGYNNMSGIEIIEKIKELNLPCNIYIVSNSIDDEFKNKAIEEGAKECFKAPLELFMLEKIF